MRHVTAIPNEAEPWDCRNASEWKEGSSRTGSDHRGSTGPATTNMAAANFVVKTCNN